MKTDVLSKIREIVRVVEFQAFPSSLALAQRLYDDAPAMGENTPFRLLGTVGGNAATVSSVITIRKHVEFCETLRLIAFHRADELLPYEALVPFGGKTNTVIEKELWAYLEREGISRKQLRSAMKKSAIHDPRSIWGHFPVRNMSKDTFRRCVYLMSLVSDDLMVNRKWTYHFRDELEVS